MGINSDFQFKQEGGEVLDAPMMPPPQPQEGADMQNLGFVNDPNAIPPQEGGEMSVADDIPREADEGDFILPYETVLLVGLKQLNRYAREAIQLAMKNNIDLAGTQLDPTDDVPIKISNYEYHIPKVLVPFFGGGKKYLDKIQKQGLDLRKRLQEEGMPDLLGEQEAEAPEVPPQEVPMAPPTDALLPQEGMLPSPPPPQEGMTAPPPPPQEAPPPMMQEGGFVKDKDEYLNEDHPDVTKEELKRFNRIFGRRPESPPISLNDIDIHNAYVQMKSRHDFTDKEIFEQTNAKVHERHEREQEKASGGFVLSKDKDAAMLEKDEAPTTQEQTRLKAQQPPMVTPDGKRVQQGFSAPAGYKHGGDVMKGLGFKLEDVNRDNVGEMVKNAEDAVNMLKGIKSSFDREDKELFKTSDQQVQKKGFATG